ncbi:MAG: hypothetical protein FJ404_01590 [Verrucomicrobia bacterium]|nr:hypothetical protein [Verrucomicrobiota bacterium]
MQSLYLPALRSLLLTLVLALTACSDRSQSSSSHGTSGGGHHHEPPHGGIGVELGDHHAQLEFLVNTTNGTVSAYVLDGHMENFIRLPAPSLDLRITGAGDEKELKLMPKANSATGETAGSTSLFEGQADWLKTATSFKATLKEIKVRGATFTNVVFSFPAAK